MVTANSWNSRPTMPPMNSTGMNTAASEKVIETMVKPISCEPSSAACMRRLARLRCGARCSRASRWRRRRRSRRQCQRHQRQVVEAEAEQVHHGERADERHRQREARDERRARRCAGTGRSPARPARATMPQRELHVVRPRRGSSASGRRESRRSSRGGSCSAQRRAAASRTASTTPTVFVPGWRWMASMMPRSIVPYPGGRSCCSRRCR